MRGIFKIRFIHKEWAMLEKIKKHKKLMIAIVVIGRFVPFKLWIF